MSIILPYWFEPVLVFYNLSWPDIDEDKVAELGEQIDAFTENVVEFADALQSVMDEINELADVEAFRAIEETFSGVNSDAITPVAGAIGESARIGGQIVATGITGYKTGLLGVLSFNLASDLVAICTPGPGTALLIAKKAAMRTLLKGVLDAMSHEAAAYLVGLWNQQIHDLIITPLNETMARIGNDLGEPVRKMASDGLSRGRTPSVGSGAGSGAAYGTFMAPVLTITESDVFDAGNKLKTAYDNLVSSVDTLLRWNRGEGYTAPTPMPDPIVSIDLKEAFDTMVDAFLTQIKAIGSDLINHLIDMIAATFDSLSNAESELSGLAARVREAFDFPVTREIMAVFDEHPLPPVVLPEIPEFMRPESLPEESPERAELERLASELERLLEAAEDAAHSVPTVAHSDASMAIRKLDLPPAPVV